MFLQAQGEASLSCASWRLVRSGECLRLSGIDGKQGKSIRLLLQQA